uniref:NADH-ubiquinone oxidoreductase chain 6 n=1 Tax=Paroster microsturtensis TaxID=610279 RepID=A0A343WA08_9DYTI|nr:NADH dehydrogenase subunit 6 [Paroster microsturtensis]AVZ66473.1 NADH dehydrogenase subunit 6 [Paroster microsturtensis]
MFIFIISLNFFMSIMFLFMNHPMSMGLTLMIQTILISLMTSMYSYSFWFSYILFLIMVGGMLILFIYMTSLAANEKFKFSPNSIIMMFIMLLNVFMILMVDKMLMLSMFKNFNMNEIMNDLSLFKNENIIALNMMYNNPNFMITIMLINYLFLTLIMVVKITKSNSGPLRQKF